MEGLFIHRLLDPTPTLSDAVGFGGGEESKSAFLSYSQRMLMPLVLGPHFENHHYNGTFVEQEESLNLRNFNW